MRKKVETPQNPPIVLSNKKGQEIYVGNGIYRTGKGSKYRLSSVGRLSLDYNADWKYVFKFTEREGFFTVIADTHNNIKQIKQDMI